MLSHLTWHQFLLCVAATGALYYLALLPLFFRDELKELLSPKKIRTNLPADQPLPPQVSILGPAAAAGPLLSDAAALRVAPPQPQPTASWEPEQAAILAEVRPLLEMALETDMGKADFLALLRLVLAKQVPVALPLDREAVSRFLLQGDRPLPFPLTSDELAALWPATPAHP